MRSLSDFRPGHIAELVGFMGGMELQSRLVEMGFVPGIHVRIVKYAPWKGLMELKIRNYYVSIRLSDAVNIQAKECKSHPHE